MNLQKIFDDTDFVHTSGTKEELQVAEYLKEVLSMEQLQKDINFLTTFTKRFANAAICPVSRTIPEKIRKELDEYMYRKRKEA